MRGDKKLIWPWSHFSCEGYHWEVHHVMALWSFRAASLTFLEHRNLSTKFPISHLLKASWSYFLDSILPNPILSSTLPGGKVEHADLHDTMDLLGFLSPTQSISFWSQSKSSFKYSAKTLSFALTSIGFHKSSIMRFKFLKQKPSFILPPGHIPPETKSPKLNIHLNRRRKKKKYNVNLKISVTVSVDYPILFFPDHLSSAFSLHSHLTLFWTLNHFTLGLQKPPWVSNSSRLLSFLSYTSTLCIIFWCLLQKA